MKDARQEPVIGFLPRSFSDCPPPALRAQYSALRTPHSVLSTQHSALSTIFQSASPIPYTISIWPVHRSATPHHRAREISADEQAAARIRSLIRNSSAPSATGQKAGTASAAPVAAPSVTTAAAHRPGREVQRPALAAAARSQGTRRPPQTPMPPALPASSGRARAAERVAVGQQGRQIGDVVEVKAAIPP